MRPTLPLLLTLLCVAYVRGQVIGDQVSIGPGNSISTGVAIGSFSSIGANNQILAATQLGSFVAVGDNNFIFATALGDYSSMVNNNTFRFVTLPGNIIKVGSFNVFDTVGSLFSSTTPNFWGDSNIFSEAFIAGGNSFGNGNVARVGSRFQSNNAISSNNTFIGASLDFGNFMLNMNIIVWSEISSVIMRSGNSIGFSRLNSIQLGNNNNIQNTQASFSDVWGNSNNIIGSIIGFNVLMGSNNTFITVRVGNSVTLGDSNKVSRGTVIADSVQIGNCVTIGDNVSLGTGAFVGDCAVIPPNAQIAAGETVGAQNCTCATP